jgi:pimeloyl-ACP methyl ester carboxylesterase
VPGGTWQKVPGESGSLMVHIASGPPAAQPSPGAGPAAAAPASAVVLVHDFPLEEQSAARTGRSLPFLADRLAAESGWRVLAGCLRGVGGSAGDFSLRGWLEDLRSLAGHAAGLAAGGGVWVVGFGVGGSIALCLAAEDSGIRGVGCLGSPATFSGWGQDPDAMVGMARRVGVIGSAGFPPSLPRWAAEFGDLRPVVAARALQGRSVLVVHGAEDDDVPLSDGRQLAEAVGRRAELRVLPGAGHRLRADPRAMALLVGWLERQLP